MEPLWTKLTIRDKDFYYRLRTASDGYKLLLTDLVRLFDEQLQEQEILRRCQELNPAVEVTDLSDLLHELGQIFNSTKSEVEATFSSQSCKLSVSGQLFNCHFVWTFDLVEASPEVFFREITCPSFAAISRLAHAQQTLTELIKAKDDEIRDYEEGGSTLARKSLKTKPFSGDLVENAAVKSDFKDILTSREYAVLSAVSTSSSSDSVEKDSNGFATQSCSKSPLKTVNPVPDAGKKRVKPSAAINPIVSSKQAKIGLTQTQSQKQLSSEVKQKLKKL